MPCDDDLKLDLMMRLEALPLLSPKQRAVLDRQLTCPTARRNSPIPNLYTALLLKHLLPPPEAKDVDRAIVHAVCARLGGMGVSLPQKNWNKGVVVLTPKFWDAVGVGLGVASNSTTGKWGKCDMVIYPIHCAGFWLVVAVSQGSVTIFDGCGLEPALPGRFRAVTERVQTLAHTMVTFLPKSLALPPIRTKVVGPRRPPPRRHGAVLTCAALEFFAARGIVPPSALTGLAELAEMPLTELEPGLGLGDESVVEGMLARLGWLCIMGDLAGE